MHPISLNDRRADRLRRLNLIMGLAHLVSGAAMVALANDFTLEIGSVYLGGPPGTPLDNAVIDSVWDVPLAWGTAGFLFLSAFFHLLIVGPAYAFYRREITAGRNRLRWVEYALSSTLMIVLIAMITGVVEMAALIGIAFANVSMILFGWLMEVANEPGDRVWWSPFWFGCVAGIGPWLAIAFGIYNGVAVEGFEGPPGFVYGILVTIFVFFNCFAVNQWLQYRGTGRWKDYVFGEIVYIVLSITAKSALAWQIFANTLIDT